MGVASPKQAMPTKKVAKAMKEKKLQVVDFDSDDDEYEEAQQALKQEQKEDEKMLKYVMRLSLMEARKAKKTNKATKTKQVSKAVKVSPAKKPKAVLAPKSKQGRKK